MSKNIRLDNENQLDIDVALLARTLAAGASADDLDMFVQQCKRTGLDPFARQICMVQRRSRNAAGEWHQKSTIMITIDGARLMAARTGLYNGSDTEWCGDDGVWQDVWLKQTQPAAARTKVRRGDYPFTGVALWREYGANASGPLWKSMGAHLLAKCSEMLALRKGFPAELSGLYSADEMAQSDSQWQSGAPASITGAMATSETPADTPEPVLEATPAPAPAPAPKARASASKAAVAGITTLQDLIVWAMDTHPLAYPDAEQVKQALRGKGIKAWSSTVDTAALQSLLTHVATSAIS